MPLSETQVIDALRQVQDPELGKDVVSLGMIKDLTIQDGAVALTLELTTPACPVREEFEENVRQTVAHIPGVTSVAMNVTAQVRGRLASGETLLPGVRNVVAIASGKGGVGKSTVSVNLALALRRLGATVGLMDADIYGPNVPLMMGVEGQQPETIDGKLGTLENYGIKLMSMGFFIPEGQAVVWRGPMIHGAIQQMLRDVDWGELDYLLIDLPPGTGDASLSLAQLVPMTGCVIVLTPSEVALQDGAKSIAMFNKLNVPILGMVENMSYLLHPELKEPLDVFGRGASRKVATKYGIDFLGEIPLDPAVRIGGDDGVPVVEGSPESLPARVFTEIAQKLAGKISVENLNRNETIPITMFTAPKG